MAIKSETVPKHQAGEDPKVHLSARKMRSHENRHVVNQIHHDDATFGERLADGAASVIGSWPFLIIQTIIVSAWVIINVVGLINRWDPYPFILLNLMFSVQAAYAGPVILLAGNRQAQKDRLTLEHASMEADKADLQNQQIIKDIDANTKITIQILQHIESMMERAEERASK